MTRLFIKMGSCGVREGCWSFRGEVSQVTPKNCETRVLERYPIAFKNMMGDV